MSGKLSRTEILKELYNLKATIDNMEYFEAHRFGGEGLITKHALIEDIDKIIEGI